MLLNGTIQCFIKDYRNACKKDANNILLLHSLQVNNYFYNSGNIFNSGKVLKTMPVHRFFMCQAAVTRPGSANVCLMATTAADPKADRFVDGMIYMPFIPKESIGKIT